MVMVGSLHEVIKMRIDTFEYKDKKLLFWEDGDNSTSVKEHMHKNNVTGIVFSRYLGFQGKAVAIHEDFKFVDEVHIIDSNIEDISFIYAFDNTRILNIQNDDRTKIDFRNFVNLQDLFLTWRKGVMNLFDKKSLLTLRLERFKEKSLDVGTGMPLRELWISSSPVENLSSLAGLKKLEVLRLSSLRCLEETSWIQGLTGLKELMISSCKKVAGTILDEVTALHLLEKLFFAKMGAFPSLSPVQRLKRLEIIGFIENSMVSDGNLAPLLELPNLKSLSMQGFSHYNPSVDDVIKHLQI